MNRFKVVVVKTIEKDKGVLLEEDKYALVDLQKSRNLFTDEKISNWVRKVKLSNSDIKEVNGSFYSGVKYVSLSDNIESGRCYVSQVITYNTTVDDLNNRLKGVDSSSDAINIALISKVDFVDISKKYEKVNLLSKVISTVKTLIK